ncbi:hypothetical protein COLO4_10453 [Corchorus olitorius]|uniref:Reverse transcriptase zinc-binding domain-containing protein n=1 Tax=Corchorus olitorius TaxID=93759 RepID=A0A1R3K8G5_9ROSI|nr:hypothetical protein COLO4_10453 [Corchorus olitorius]
MTVQRRNGSNQGNKGQNKNSSPHQDKASGSRFTPLHLEEQDKPTKGKGKILAAKDNNVGVFKAGKNILTHHHCTPPILRQVNGKAKPLQEITNQPSPVSRPKPAATPTQLDEISLAKYLHIPAYDDFSSTLVSEFLDDFGWNIDKLREYLPSEIVDKISCILVKPVSNLSDRIIWSRTTKGIFTTNSAYRSTTEAKTDQDQSHSAIWKCKVQPKIQTFLWLASNNRILCNENRRNKSLTSDPKCNICGAVSEFVIHLLKDCTNAAEIRKALMIDTRFHSCAGRWLGGFAFNIGNFSIDVAKLWAIFQGVTYAKKLNLNYLEIESDSANSIQAVKQGVNENHPLFPLAHATQQLLGEDWT